MKKNSLLVLNENDKYILTGKTVILRPDWLTPGQYTKLGDTLCDLKLDLNPDLAMVIFSAILLLFAVSGAGHHRQLARSSFN